MLFNSINFLIFLPIAVGMYYIIPKRYCNLWLLLVSYYFYMSWNAIYMLLIFFSTLSTWLCAGLITKYRQKSVVKKSALAVNILLNVGILFTFKYYGMFTSTITDAFAAIGIDVLFPSLTLLLPVGISFYTFQALGYSIDVYRNSIQHEKNFLDYALFVSFFPQLVAGPIERSSNLLPQFEKDRSFCYENFKIGGRLMLLGYFKKVAVADNLAVMIDEFYLRPEIWPAPLGVLTIVAFSLQVYFDFSGYTDIARGCAKILGIDLMKNFDHPYCATNFSMFWSRWHISLSTWFKDYLYIPLGGSRKGTARTYINLLIVFLVSGLWHGAAWTFVIWGALQGIFSVAELFIKKTFVRAKNTALKIPNIAKQFTVFTLWTLSLVFFRSESIGSALSVFKGLTIGWGTLLDTNGIIEQLFVLFGDINSLLGILLCVAVILTIESIEVVKGKDFHELFNNKPFVCRWGIYYALLFIIVAFGAFGQSSFIYFQF